MFGGIVSDVSSWDVQNCVLGSCSGQRGTAGGRAVVRDLWCSPSCPVLGMSIFT